MPRDTKSGRGGKSNKTARVLNLLTDPDSVAAESAHHTNGEAETQSAAKKAHSANDENTQAQIRDALEMELELSVKPEHQPVPPQPVAEPAPAPAAPPQSVVEPAPAPAALPQPVAEPAPAEDDEQDNDNYTCLNVTQALVEEKADKYIKMFGMCTCNRCRIDVIAMSLSNLPAKYVVVKNEDINPRLSFYEQKYNAAVITQVMGACKKVLERPHHKR